MPFSWKGKDSGLPLKDPTETDGLLRNAVFAYTARTCTLEARSTYTRFIRTVSFVPTKSSYIFSKINPLYTDTG